MIEDGRLRKTPEAFERRFASERPMRMAIEARTHSPWASKQETDEVDAQNLARLARLDLKLLHPLKHWGEDSRAHLAIIRSRQASVDYPARHPGNALPYSSLLDLLPNIANPNHS